MIVSASGIPRFTHRKIGDDFALTWAHLKCAPVTYFSDVLIIFSIKIN